MLFEAVMVASSFMAVGTGSDRARPASHSATSDKNSKAQAPE